MTLSKALNRANSVASFFSSVFFAVLAAVALTGPLLLYSSPHPSASVAISKASVKVGRLGYYYDSKQPLTELGTVFFDLNADLSPLFNWNTKQLFLMLVVEYETPTHSFNQVTIWDDIITSKDDAKIKLKKKKCEYLLSDISHKIGGLNANLTLHWDIMPHVGFLIHGRGDPTEVKIPAVENKKKGSSK